MTEQRSQVANRGQQRTASPPSPIPGDVVWRFLQRVGLSLLAARVNDGFVHSRFSGRSCSACRCSDSELLRFCISLPKWSFSHGWTRGEGCSPRGNDHQFLQARLS